MAMEIQRQGHVQHLSTGRSSPGPALVLGEPTDRHGPPKWQRLLGGFVGEPFAFPPRVVPEMDEPHAYAFQSADGAFRGFADIGGMLHTAADFGGGNQKALGGAFFVDGMTKSSYRFDCVDRVPFVGGILANLPSGETRFQHVGFGLWLHDRVGFERSSHRDGRHGNSRLMLHAHGTLIHTFDDMTFRVPLLSEFEPRDEANHFPRMTDALFSPTVSLGE